ncbi:C45 family peptidase [Dinghuibacter silviterrae]|uniref:Acyl-CoA:6-aminopenicillanic acid acyl transferase n=1 Tax=Dinghuibacter silviterrae TaxID=1539049 RepID=A0A4R8DV61_9BACT|nr:C45 family peptidase [Dinghuibacter silviterrae]TDX02294.1 acyl-CoA:6-aminopenicillanic acid acyl transferase [Dinghuibacter silviterrae]
MIALFIIVGLLIAGACYAWSVTRLRPPRIDDRTADALIRAEVAPGVFTIGPNWLRKSTSGLYEMYVEGRPYERGVVNGKLAAELVVLQEDYFNEQIVKMIPGERYLKFLKYFVGWFNRKLPRHVTTEYKQEIFGVSRSASDKYGYIGTPYQRILNYHAAHDIGHALQNLALVGCTSFGTWGSRSVDGALIIGRNFDFYVGDHFALNKIVQFEAPSEGHRFAFVTWGGFIGVVSGMNEKGLTVTINAAKSGIPMASATPVSLVAREILQYAGTIDEAVRIARSRRMFVSESFLIGSAADGKAILVEKTPKALEVYDPGGERILCANHFQSTGLRARDGVRTRDGLRAPDSEGAPEGEGTASPYRQRRLEELLDGLGPNTVEKTIGVLRDVKGLGGADIGLGNEKSVNQLIAHHSVVFEPQQLRMWVSTAPWQEGAFMCYDLRKAWANLDPREELSTGAIPPDPLMGTPAFAGFLAFRELKHQMDAGETIDPEALVKADPEYYHAYVLAGDYCYKRGERDKARAYYEEALTKEIATAKEEAYIRKQIQR